MSDKRAGKLQLVKGVGGTLVKQQGWEVSRVNGLRETEHDVFEERDVINLSGTFLRWREEMMS